MQNKVLRWPGIGCQQLVAYLTFHITDVEPIERGLLLSSALLILYRFKLSLIIDYWFFLEGPRKPPNIFFERFPSFPARYFMLLFQEKVVIRELGKAPLKN